MQWVGTLKQADWIVGVLDSAMYFLYLYLYLFII